MERLPYMMGEGDICVGDRVAFIGRPVFGFSNAARERPTLEIGDHTVIGHEVSIQVGERVSIGRHCYIAGKVQMRDFGGHPTDAARRRSGVRPSAEEMAPVTIGDDVWIGEYAIILPGVTIGDRSIVAVNSVVGRDVPPDVVVAGHPARFAKRMSSAEEPNDDRRQVGAAKPSRDGADSASLNGNLAAKN